MGRGIEDEANSCHCLFSLGCVFEAMHGALRNLLDVYATFGSNREI